MAIEDELRVVLLLVVVWTTELACTRMNASPIIGQIAAGLAVGPALLDLIPHIEAFKLLGKLGVMVLVVESGLAVNINEIRRFGGRASLAAATGVLLPTLLSFALYSGVLGAGWKAALAVGAALSPTSLGFSAQLLGEVGQLATPIGQLICTAAVIDDVLSLLLLAEVQALGANDPKWYDYAIPVLASAGSIVVGGVAAVLISSKTEPLGAWLASLDGISDRQKYASPSVEVAMPLEGDVVAATDTASVPPGTQNAAESGEERGVGLVGKGDRVLLVMVLAFSLVFAYLSSLVGSSDLLGCFLGGLAFSGVPGVQRIWARQV
ncbi:unnamed protein product, partial [Hapterophycus canaliculatus]